MYFVDDNDWDTITKNTLQAGGLLNLVEGRDIGTPYLNEQAEKLEAAALSRGLRQTTTLRFEDGQRVMRIRWYRETLGDLGDPDKVGDVRAERLRFT